MIGRGCQLSPDAQVVSSILMDDCSVAESAVVSGSVLGRHVVVPKGCTLDGCVIGDNMILESDQLYVNERIPSEGDA